jgi:hypothetical protein
VLIEQEAVAGGKEPDVRRVAPWFAEARDDVRNRTLRIFGPMLHGAVDVQEE